MFRTIDVSPGTDLSQFSRLLWQRRIAHRIVEHEGRQVLLIAREERIPEAMQLYQGWQRGEVSASGQDGGLGGYLQTDALLGSSMQALGQNPLTILLIAACIVLYWLAPLARPTELTWALLYPDFSFGTRVIVLSRVIDNFSLLQLLRMLSPILLHGGVLHLVFNMLWLWELGKRVELRQGSLLLGAAIVVLALVSNTAQYLYGGGNNFGGMSGVVYGLFAYIWMWQLFAPKAGLNLPLSLVGFMLASLVLMTVLDLDMIANQAHLGGFAGGLVYGAATATLSRLRRRA